MSGSSHDQTEGAGPPSVFSTKPRPFPEPVDGRISTAQFLEAASSVVVLVEQLGKVFSPVRYDMNGNIQKITDKYNEDTVKFKYLNDMLMVEQAEGALRATDALLWLRRALHFIHYFLQSICEDTKANKRPEDLSVNVRRAYMETLESYHGWMAQRLFYVLSKMVPSRSQLLTALTLNAEMSEETFFAELEQFLNNLDSNLKILSNFYMDHKLDLGLKCS